MNRQQIPSKLGTIISELLRQKGYVAVVDVFMKLGYLDSKDYENWRLKRIPYLEKAIKVNLGRISYIMKALRESCREASVLSHKYLYIYVVLISGKCLHAVYSWRHIWEKEERQ